MQLPSILSPDPSASMHSGFKILLEFTKSTWLLTDIDYRNDLDTIPLEVGLVITFLQSVRFSDLID